MERKDSQIIDRSLSAFSCTPISSHSFHNKHFVISYSCYISHSDPFPFHSSISLLLSILNSFSVRKHIQLTKIKKINHIQTSEMHFSTLSIVLTVHLPPILIRSISMMRELVFNKWMKICMIFFLFAFFDCFESNYISCILICKNLFVEEIVIDA